MTGITNAERERRAAEKKAEFDRQARAREKELVGTLKMVDDINGTNRTDGYTLSISISHAFEWNRYFQVVKPTVTDGLLPNETPDELAARLRADCLAEITESANAFKDYLKRSST